MYSNRDSVNRIRPRSIGTPKSNFTRNVFRLRPWLMLLPQKRRGLIRIISADVNGFESTDHSQVLQTTGNNDINNYQGTYMQVRFLGNDRTSLDNVVEESRRLSKH